MLKSLNNWKETTKHKLWVLFYSLKFCHKLILRAIVHDFSKYSRREAKPFSEYTPKLKACTYGSEEYQTFLKGLKPALDHHYNKNSHHPEHHKNGFDDMSGLDRVEMVIDWFAATRRHADGDIMRSIEVNKDRFKYSDDDKKWLQKIIGDVR
jgi:hypothetical protein